MKYINGNLLAEQSFGAWGRMRDPETWEYTIVNNQSSIINGRGYTGHEMLPKFGLINMNGRLYDPVLGRMLSPDNYIQMPDFTQNFNRYSYVMNNPLKYTDPSGDFWGAFTIGAIMGGVSGMQIARMKGYGFDDWQLYAYSVGGSVIGGFSGGMASEVAASGGFMANTVSIAYGSGANSIGMYALSGGTTEVSVGFGAGSYNFTSNEWGYPRKSGNSIMQNVGYVVGALTNLQDGFAGFNGRNDIEVGGSIATPGEMGHAETRTPNGDILISVIAKNKSDRELLAKVSEADLVNLSTEELLAKYKVQSMNKLKYELYRLKRVTNTYKGINSRDGIDEAVKLYVPLKNVRGTGLVKMTEQINEKTLDGTLRWGWGNFRHIKYPGIGGTGCIHYSRLGLLRAGIPTLPIIFPISLPLELWSRQMINYNMSYFINGF